MNGKELLNDLIKFNTVEDKENTQIMYYIEKKMKEKGFKVDYKSKNLVMSIKDECNLGFLGHTDTVQAGADWTYNPFEITECEGRLYGLGTSDMKGGLAAIIQSVLETDWDNQKSGIKLFFTYDEEIGFGGIRELIQEKVEFPKYMIIGEPTNNVIMNGSKGLLELKISFDGISVHSSMPQKGVNAIEKCMDFLNELKQFYNQLKQDTSKNFEVNYTTMNIGKINGGKSINIVPNYCEVLIDFRVTKEEHSVLILNEIEQLISKFNGKFEVINNIKPFINKDESITSTDFITEASFINSSIKYILGVGPNNAHKANEYITEESYVRLVEQYKSLIYKYCNDE